jgi:spore maturation protein CgeB
MKFVLYTHSLVSDWNHGNVHFQRGVLRELTARGHDVLALEPAQGWSRTNLFRDQGWAPFAEFHKRFPELRVRTFDADFDHAAAIADADVVIVHEWTDPDLIAKVGGYRRSGGAFTLLFHDTHHRAISAQTAMAELMLEDYDAILAFGEALSARYRANGWGRQVFTWHEAADTRLFRPMPNEKREKDLTWIGNWGDEERTRELETFLIEPARALGLTGTVHGVRYPESALAILKRRRLTYSGWLANADVPAAFARHRATVHIPRRPYVDALRGIPTIRVFEALACGIPLVCAVWDDAEGLFRPGVDFLVAHDSDEMTRCLSEILHAPDLAASLAAKGLETVLARHTCTRRVDELLEILAIVGTMRVRQSVLANEAAE